MRVSNCKPPAVRPLTCCTTPPLPAKTAVSLLPLFQATRLTPSNQTGWLSLHCPAPPLAGSWPSGSHVSEAACETEPHKAKQAAEANMARRADRCLVFEFWLEMDGIRAR